MYLWPEKICSSSFRRQ